MSDAHVCRYISKGDSNLASSSTFHLYTYIKDTTRTRRIIRVVHAGRIAELQFALCARETRAECCIRERNRRCSQASTYARVHGTRRRARKIARAESIRRARTRIYFRCWNASAAARTRLLGVHILTTRRVNHATVHRADTLQISRQSRDPSERGRAARREDSNLSRNTAVDA